MVVTLLAVYAQILVYLNMPIVFTLAFLMFLIIELPIYISVFVGAIAYVINKMRYIPDANFTPTVSCIVPCYSEKEGALRCVKSLVEQNYTGNIQIIAIVDGSVQNKITYDILIQYFNSIKHTMKSQNRELHVIGKVERQGRVSSLNLGFYLSKNEIIFALDADNLIHEDMIATATQNFRDPDIVAGTGTLFVANQNATLVTIMQSIEYNVGICLGRTGLGALGVLNNISGAFGIFRRTVLAEVGAWDAGTAEDLDLTMRLKKRIALHPHEKLFFDPLAICYTDAPDTLKMFLNQRLRWNGDLGYLYLRKRWNLFYYNLMGWKNTVYTAWYGILHQIVCPFLIFAYTIFFGLWDTQRFIVVSLAVYVFYYILFAIFYGLYWFMISPRKANDAWLFLFSPIYPIFTYICRLWDVVAHLNEAFRKGHLDSSMAPKHILKRGKF